MARRWRRILLVLVALVVAGAVALVLTGRARLDDDRDAVDDAWPPLRASLVARYDALAAVDAELRAAGGGDRDVAPELSEELARWQDAAARPDDEADVDAEVAIANTLEGLSARVLRVVNSSERLRSSTALVEALAAFPLTAPDPDLVRSYNDAVDDYNAARDSLLRRPAAAVFDYEARTSFEQVQ